METQLTVRVVNDGLRAEGRRFLLLTAPLARLEREAERLRVDKRLRESFWDPYFRQKQWWEPNRSHALYSDFSVSRREEFALCEGRLFTSLERQR
eukprot:6173130-Pleurochrysis_carterae.AAC.2